MACCTGAAPRHAGSSEKCRFTHPRGGMSRAARGTSAPYATTGQQSGCSSARRARKSSSRGRSGVSTSTSAASAMARTGLATTRRPRPAGRSGLVTTATTSWRGLSSSARSVGTATAGVPAKTRRTLDGEAACRVRRDLDNWIGESRPLRLADRLHRELALLRTHPVDEQDAVEVVDLVLDATRHQLGAFNRDGVAVHVETARDDTHMPGRRERQAREGQTPLVAVLLLVALQADDGVDEVADDFLDVIGEDPQAHTDLRRGQACT